MNIDRRIAPAVLPVSNIVFPKIENYILENGIPVYLINEGVHEVVKIDLVFEAGHWNCNNPLLADFTNRMLIEGSNEFSSAEIAEKFDYLGTFINYECGKHFANTQLYCLKHFVEESLKIFNTYVKFPTFPDDGFKIHLKNEYQQYILAQEKTEVVASEAFYSKVFGEEHPYGISRKKNDFDGITINDLRKHHQLFYNPTNCKIIVSGQLPDNIHKLLNKYFGKTDWSLGKKVENKTYSKFESDKEQFVIKKKGAVQASIRLGKEIINKKHPDYQALSILNTILGGYYGSRLMMNLREKNALTYGVHSSLLSLLYSGILSISLNVNLTSIDLAIEQILTEIEKLKTELISNNELSMVKNYLSGEMLRAFDGPLSVSEIYAGLLNYNLGYEYYQNYFNTLKSINAFTLREIANKYLNPDDFIQIIVKGL